MGRRVVRNGCWGREPEPGSTDQCARWASQIAKQRGGPTYSARRRARLITSRLRRSRQGMVTPTTALVSPVNRCIILVHHPRSPYLAANAFSTAGASEFGSIRAVASIDRPRGLPRMLQGAICARPLRRIRLTLPESRMVQTRSSSPIRTTQTGVGTGVPSFRNVVSNAYGAAPSTSRAAGEFVTLSRCREWSSPPASGTRCCSGSCATDPAPAPVPAGCPARPVPGGA